MRLLRRQALAGATISALGWPANTANAAPGPNDLAIQLMARLEQFGFSGGAFVVDPVGTHFFDCRGLADQTRLAKFHANTPFNIASITKTFTALCVMRAVQDGWVALDDPVSKYFPDAPPQKAGIIISQLLSHAGGLRRDSLNGARSMSRDAAVNIILKAELPQTPGAGMHYSNDGYRLLAAILEVASGQSYRDLVRETIFKPAGMRNSGFTQDYVARIPIAHGYNEWADLGTFVDHTPRGWDEGEGNIVSTCADIQRFVGALSAGRIVPASALGRMRQIRATSPDDPTEQYGYGWFAIRGANGSTVWLHGGDNPGYHTELRWYEDARRWIFVVTTKELYHESGVGVAVHMRQVANDFNLIFNGVAPTQGPPAARPIPSDDLVGVYASPSGGRLTIWRASPRDSSEYHSRRAQLRRRADRSASIHEGLAR